MFAAFRQRRPWAAALIALLFDPFTAMLYLGRGWLALMYLVAEVAAFAAALSFLSAELPWTPQVLGYLATIPVRLFGTIHSSIVGSAYNAHATPKWYARWYSVVAIVLALPLSALVIRTFLYQPFNSTSASMSPNINVGDYFLVEKWTYRLSEPKRGDVVAFGTRHGVFVKRVVGLPGDRVQFTKGIVWLNGAPVQLHFVGRFTLRCIEDRPCDGRVFEETLAGGGQHLVIYLDPDLPQDNTPIFIVPPRSFFVVGDNRDNSNDSRLDVGFVPEGSILGRAAFKFWNENSRRLILDPIK